MIRIFFKDTFIYGISSVLSRGVGLLLLPIFTRYLVPSDYGKIDLINIFGTIAGIFVALEISQGLARYFPAAKSPRERLELASTSFWFTVIGYTGFLVLVWWQSPVFSKLLFENADDIVLFRLGALYIFSNALFYIIQNQLRWDCRAGPFASLAFVQTLSGFFLSYLFIVPLHMGIIGFFLGQIISMAAGIAGGLYFCRTLLRFEFHAARLKAMLSFSLPLVPAALGTMITLYIDRLAIKRFLSLADVGIFGISYRFASLGTILILGFQMALTPLVYRHFEDKSTPDKIARITRLFLALIFPIAVFVGLFSHEIIAFFTTSGFHQAAVSLPFLFLAVLLSQMYIFFPGLGIAKKTAIISGLSIASALLNTLLNMVLVPAWGIMGATLSTLASSFFLLSGWAWFGQKYYPIAYEWKEIILSAIYAILACSLPHVFLPMNAMIFKSICWVCFVLSLFSANMVRKSELTAVWEIASKRIRPGD